MGIEDGEIGDTMGRASFVHSLALHPSGRSCVRTSTQRSRTLSYINIPSQEHIQFCVVPVGPTFGVQAVAPCLALWVLQRLSQAFRLHSV
jgi:hypothetical protein